MEHTLKDHQPADASAAEQREPSLKLNGRTALVTGGGSGIGRAIAVTCSRRGAHVYVADIDAGGAQATVLQLRDEGLLATALVMDVAKAQSVAAGMAQVLAERGRLHVLVNCAGVDDHGPIGEMTEAVYDKVLGVDLKSVYLVTRAALPLLQLAGSSAVVNISSVMAWYTAPGYVAYTAAKAGVLGMTRALATELGQFGVRVNAICPGFIDTPMWHHNLAKLELAAAEEYAERVRRLHPVGRRGLPGDVAYAVAFLCSDQGAFVSGAALVVDGAVTTRIVNA